MKNYTIPTLLAIVAAAVVITANPNTAQASGCVATEDESGVLVQTLFAGQSIDTGDVTVEIVENQLVVTYETLDDWLLSETHLWVGSSLSEMPQTAKGNPKIGNFPYASQDISGATSYSFSVPLQSIGFSCPGEDKSIFIAAHAVVYRPDGSGGYQTETGWAAGERFVEKGSWATYFTSTLTCDCNEPPIPSTCETAFAFGVEEATCFLDLDFDGNGKKDFNRWGWTNGPLSEGSYGFEIYAGAGQCDLSKGTHVGTLNVTYQNGAVFVVFEAFSDFGFEETHLYVGSEPLARDVNGEYTVAPGQYPYIHEQLGETDSNTFTVSGVSGDIYIVAHAVTCGYYE